MKNHLCWASPLDDCEGKVSREHYVSEAFFSSPTVQIQGLHWCKAEPKTIGISSATSKILCEKHNSLLSPLDAEAGLFMQAIREHLRLTDARSKPRFAPFHIKSLSVNARLLERWLLKVLLNLSFGGALKIGLDGVQPGKASLRWVNVCFGRSPFEGRCGMYVGSYAGMSLEMGETLRYSPAVREDQRILGGFFTVAGIYFYLCLEPGGISVPMREVAGVEPMWAKSSLTWRFHEMITEISHRRSHVIRFNWHPTSVAS